MRLDQRFESARRLSFLPASFTKRQELPAQMFRGVAVGECHREKLIAEQLSCYPAKRSLPCLRPRDFFKQRPRTAGRRACDRVLCISLGAREYLTPRCYPPPRPR